MSEVKETTEQRKQRLAALKALRESAKSIKMRIRYIVGIPQSSLNPGSRPKKPIWKAFMDTLNEKGEIIMQNPITVAFDDSLGKSEGWGKLMKELTKKEIEVPKKKEGFKYYELVLS